MTGGLLSLSGKTVDVHSVFSGVGTLSTTHGIPLEVALSWLKDFGAVVDWADYIATFRKDGHNRWTIRGRVLAAVGDVFGVSYLGGFAPVLDAALGVA